MKECYCLDTSALIDIGVRWYPIEAFPSLWQKLDELVAGGRLIIPAPVAMESRAKDDGVSKWIRKHQKSAPNAFINPDSAIQGVVTTISTAFPGWVSRGRNTADPFVVATAHTRNLIVVTGEHPSTSLPIANPVNPKKFKIPNVCQQFSVKWLGVPDMIRGEGWKF